MSQTALFGDVITRQEMLLEVERELALRRRVYPRWIEAGRLKLDRAERQIAVLEAVAVLLAETLPSAVPGRPATSAGDGAFSATGEAR